MRTKLGWGGDGKGKVESRVFRQSLLRLLIMGQKARRAIRGSLPQRWG